MINPLRMASLHRLYDLQERPRDERVVVDVSALLNDAGEEVAAVAVLEDDVYESWGGDDFAEGDYVGVGWGAGGDEVVEVELSLLELELTGGEVGVGEDFDGCWGINQNEWSDKRGDETEKGAGTNRRICRE
jgi:hypothetical protein